MQILIVEDNATDLKLARSILKRAGHEVTDAGSAEEAVEMLQRKSPQLILTDLQLPLMDGVALTRQLKQGEKTADIPVIAMTSFPDSFSKRKIRDAGFAAYLIKPLNTRTLSLQVDEAVPERALPL